MECVFHGSDPYTLVKNMDSYFKHMPPVCSLFSEDFSEFPLQLVVTQELTLYGSCSSNGEYEMALNLIAYGKIRVRELITCIAPLSSGAELFSKLYNSEEEMSSYMYSF